MIFPVMRNCIGAYRRLGGAAFRVHVVAGQGEGWGWRQEGKGSGPGEVQLPGDLLPGDGPPNLEDTQDIHHHLLGVRVFGSGHSHFKIMYHRKCMLHKLLKHYLVHNSNYKRYYYPISSYAFKDIVIYITQPSPTLAYKQFS